MMKGYYKKETPVKWRKIGDAILFLSVSLSGMIMGLPLTDNQALWAIFICNISGVLGKTITNFFKDGEEEAKSADNE